MEAQEYSVNQKHWKEAIDKAEDFQSSWIERARKIECRYRDEVDRQSTGERRMNLLWSNTETMKPALYFRKPNPQISRRFKTSPPANAPKEIHQVFDQNLEVTNRAAMALEGAVKTSIDMQDFDDVLNSNIEDLLLPGRATVVVKYKPTYDKQRIPAEPINSSHDEYGREIPDYSPEYAEDVEYDEASGEHFTLHERVSHEECNLEYVYWQDFVVPKAKGLV